MAKNAEDVYYDPDIRLLACCWMPDLRSWFNADLSAPHWRLYWNSVPGATVRFAGRLTALGPSRLVLIPHDTPYQSLQYRPVGHLFIHFLARPPFQAVRPAIFTFSAPPEIKRLIRKLRTLLRSSEVGPQAATLARCLVYYALSRLPDPVLVHPPEDGRIADALARIDQSPVEPPTNTQLAQDAGMTVNGFIRLFHQVVGVSPQFYSRQRRIERACLLLTHSSATIKQIAEATGFCDRYHFTRVFRRLRLESPAHYRAHARAAVREP